MKLLTVSNLSAAKDYLVQCSAKENNLIGVGVLLPNGQKEDNFRVALFDVTEEVEQRQLDVNNLPLVNAFIHARQDEISKQIDENPVPAVLHAVGGH